MANTYVMMKSDNLSNEKVYDFLYRFSTIFCINNGGLN